MSIFQGAWPHVSAEVYKVDTSFLSRQQKDTNGSGNDLAAPISAVSMGAALRRTDSIESEADAKKSAGGQTSAASAASASSQLAILKGFAKLGWSYYREAATLFLQVRPDISLLLNLDCNWEIYVDHHF